ncbi:MAG: L-lactate dehydrogenase [SAR324 cluster bacterium]
MSIRMLVPASAGDFRLLAKRRLPRVVFDYIDGGANEERTMARNREDFLRIRLRQRALQDASKLNTRAEMLGASWAMPVGLAPVGLAGTYARRGEVQAARAAEAAGVPFTLSTVGICTIEEVRAAIAGPFWFQLYMLKDRGFVRELLGRAQAAGCNALLWTVDSAVAGARRRDVRHGVMGANGLGAGLAKLADYLSRPRWLLDVALRGAPLGFGNLADILPKGLNLVEQAVWFAGHFDPGLTWKDLEWLRGQWSGPLVVKGLLDANDARAAAERGADGIVISNHGGRQLDSVSSTVSALPRIVEAVGGRLEVLIDGGIHSGQDLAKALALGAKGGLVGRAWAWALGARGERGVGALLALLRRELEITLALTGANDVAKLNSAVLPDDE